MTENDITEEIKLLKAKLENKKRENQSKKNSLFLLEQENKDLKLSMTTEDKKKNSMVVQKKKVQEEIETIQNKLNEQREKVKNLDTLKQELLQEQYLFEKKKYKKK
eukprot:TRINITY_DN2145_c0_g1_i1.p2 TRINITY_DN2145_c0_g1~~TRINITY_DN2145_c0_g1_i1.p2  ORF type:complete len:106 (+),score=21.03 TRINITY_DN2145_c0_g1_i1:69-386(+)